MNNDTVEERILSMQFDNRQFQRNIEATTESLEKFEEALDFDDVGQSFDEMSETFDEFSQNADETFDGLLAGLKDKFGDLASAVKTIMIYDIGRSIYVWGKSMIKSLSVDQITEGYDKYEQYVKSSFTIANATNKSIDEVDDSLERLMWFSDETSYSFTDMADNVGKFTSQGIDLDVAVKAMQGIALAAADAGQGTGAASSAMYNFAQALAAGRVQLQDWRSINNANISTERFKETIIATAVALGQLREGGYTKRGTKVTATTFENTLSEGWFTSDVLIKSLEKYSSYAETLYDYMNANGIDSASEAMEQLGDAGNKLGYDAFIAGQKARSFADAINAVKDAVSTGWLNTFSILIGDSEESSELFTDLANGMWEVFAAGADSRNELLKEWVDLGGREELIQGLYDALSGLWDLLQTVRDGFLSVFPDITADNLMNLTHIISNFGAQIKETFGFVHKTISTIEDAEDEVLNVTFDFDGQIQRGMKGDTVKHMQEWLQQAGYGLGHAGVDGIFGPDTEAALKKFQEDTGLTVNGIYDDATHFALGKALFGTHFIQYLKPVETVVTELTGDGERIQRIFAGVGAVVSIAMKIGQLLINVGQGIFKAFGPLIDVVLDIAAAIGDFFVSLDSSEGTATVFQNILEIINGYIATLAEKIQFFATILRLIFFGPESVEEVNDTLKDFSKWIEKVKNAIKNSRIGKWFSSLSESIPKFIEDIKNKGFIQTIKDWFINAWEDVKNYFVSGQYKTDISNSIETIKTEVNTFISSVMTSLFGFGSEKTDKEGNTHRRRTPFMMKLDEYFGPIIDFFTGIAEKVDTALETIKGTEWWQWMSEKYNAIKTAIIDFFVGLAGGDTSGAYNPETGQTKTGKNLTSREMSSIETLGVMLSSVWTSIVLFFNTMYDIVSSEWDIITNSEWWANAKELVVATKNAIIDFFMSIFFPSKSGDDKASSFEKLEELEPKVSLLERITAICSTVWDAISGFFIGLWQGVVSVYNFITSAETWQAVGNWLTTTFNVIVDTFRSFGQVLSDFWNDETTQTIIDILPYLIGVAATLLLLRQLGPIISAITGVATSANNAAKAASKATQAKYEFAKTAVIVAGVVLGIAVIAAAIYFLGSQMTTGQLIQGIIAVVIIMGLLFGGIAIMTALVKRGKIDETMVENLQGFAGMILEIVGVLALFGLLIYLLSLIKPAQFFTGLGYLTIIVGLLAVFIIALNKLKSTKLYVTGLMQVGVVLAIMAGLAVLLGFIPFEHMLNGVKNLGILMGLLVAFMFLTTHLTKSGDFGSALYAMQTVAIAVAILAGVAVVLGMIPQSVLTQGIISVGLLMALLFGFTVGVMLLGKGQDMKTDNLIKIVGVLALMGVIVLLLGLLPKSVLIKGLIAIGVLGLVLAGLAFMLYLMKKAGPSSTKDAASIIVIGSVLAVLMGIIMLMCLVPADKLMRSLAVFAVVGLVVGGIAALVLVMKKQNIHMKDMAPLIMIGGLIAILMGVLMILAQTPIPQLQAATWALVAIAGAVVAITAMTLVASKFGGGTGKTAKGALGISAALAIVTLTMTAIVGGLGWLNNATNGGLVKSIISGARVLAALKDALDPFIEDLESVVAIAAYLAVSTIVGATGQAGNLVVGSLAVDLAFIGLVATCTAIVAGLGKLDGITDGDLSVAIEAGALVLQGLGKALGSFATGLLTALSEGIEKLGTAIASFREGVAGLDEDYDQGTLEADIEAAKAIYLGLRDFFVESVKQKFQEKVGLNYYDLAAEQAEQLNSSIKGFGEAFDALRNGVDGLDQQKKEIEESVRVAQEQAQALYDFFSGLKAYSVYQKGGLVKNYFTAPEQLSTDIQKFGEAIGSFASNVAWLSAAYPTLPADVDAALATAREVNRFFDEIQPGNEEFGGVKGKSNSVSEYNRWVEGFLGHLDTLGQNISGFKLRVEGIGDSTLEADTEGAIGALRKVADFMNDIAELEIEREPGAFGRFLGRKTKFSTIISGIGSMSKTLNEARINLSALGVTKEGYHLDKDVEGAIEVLTQVATFSEQVTGMTIETDPTFWESLFGTKDKTGFQQVIDNLGKMDFSGINNLENKKGLIGLSQTTIVDDIGTAITVLENIGTLTQSLHTSLTDSETGAAIDPFSTVNRVSSTLDVFKQYLTDFSSEEFSSVYGNVQTLQENITSLVSAFDTDLPTAIDGSLAQSIKDELDNMVAVFGAGNPTAVTSIQRVCDGFKLIFEAGLSSANQSIRTGFYEKFATTGEYLAIGVSNGLRRQKANIKTAAAEIIRAALQAMAEEGKIKSPSRATYEFGMFMIQGLRNGLRDYSDEATNASRHVITDMIETMSSLLSEDMDLTPRITPVLDMSNVSTGVSKMNGLFGQRSLNLGTSVGLAKSVTQNNQNGTIAKAFGNSDVVSAIGALKDEVNTLKANIGGLKVYMDSGALVGQIGPKMDGYLGHRAALERRRG